MCVAVSCTSLPSTKKDQKLVIRNTNNSSSISKYYFTIKTQINSILEYREKEVKNANTSQIGIIYDISADTAGNSIIKMTYDKLIVDIDKTGKVVSIDASNGHSSFNPTERILSSILGLSVNVSLNQNGEIKSIQGCKEISDKILASLSEYDQALKSTIQEQVSRLVNEDFIRNNIQESFKLIPDTGVYVGTTWNRKATQTGEISYLSDCNYILTSLEDTLAEIDVEASVKGIPGKTQMPKNPEVKTNLNGKQEGKLFVNRHTGILEKSKSKTLIDGTVQVMENEVPISIVIKKEITSRKI